jgi:proteasome lid subunit RPN8/RPN11
MTKQALHLSDALAAEILLAAARAYPSECCGLIEGTDCGDGWQVRALHETANVAEDKTRHFTIDPQRQFDLLRALRGMQTRIIGCFHSHPDGNPEPSATDRAHAYEPDFLWLIAGGSPHSGFTLNAYHFREETGFVPIRMQDDDGFADAWQVAPSA